MKTHFNTKSLQGCNFHGLFNLSSELSLKLSNYLNIIAVHFDKLAHGCPLK